MRWLFVKGYFADNRFIRFRSASVYQSSCCRTKKSTWLNELEFLDLSDVIALFHFSDAWEEVQVLFIFHGVSPSSAVAPRANPNAINSVFNNLNDLLIVLYYVDQSNRVISAATPITSTRTTNTVIISFVPQLILLSDSDAMIQSF